MSWRDIETAIQGDLDAEKLRQQRRTLRSESINDGWWELWTDAISCVTADAGELDKKLQNARLLSLGNNLGVVKLDEYHYLVQNPAFPKVSIDLVCKPAKSITVTGTMCQSAFRSQQIHPSRFTFDADMNYQPYLAEETRGCFSSSQLADLVMDQIAEFFRGVASR